jgi:hypothetical protein
MLKKAQIILAACVLLSISPSALADRGAIKKSKSKAGINLNIKTPVSLRNSISFNLKSGLVYKGSTLGSNTNTNSNMGIRLNTGTVTYQKGNTIYILPYKHKIAVPEVRQGYAGMKLIIRSQ